MQQRWLSTGLIKHHTSNVGSIPAPGTINTITKQVNIMSQNKSRLTVITNSDNHSTDSDIEESGVDESNSVLRKNIDKFDKVLIIGFSSGQDGNKIDIHHTQNMNVLEVNWLKTVLEKYIDSLLREDESDQT